MSPKPPVVGFTGTQDKITDEQWFEVYDLLCDIVPGEFHHGDCIGADKEAHLIALGMRIPVILHPPSNNDKRAHCWGSAIELPAKDYLARNRDIVDACDVLIACPKGPEVLRSGTWSTVRYAQKMNKKVHVIMPDGKVTVLEPNPVS